MGDDGASLVRCRTRTHSSAINDILPDLPGSLHPPARPAFHSWRQHWQLLVDLPAQKSPLKSPRNNGGEKKIAAMDEGRARETELLEEHGDWNG